MNNWILVSERLPEEDKNVLVTYLGFRDNQPRCSIARYKNEKWYWEEDKEDNEPVIVEIVAWQYVEPCEIISLTDDEIKLLEVLYNQGLRWMCRGYNTSILFFKEDPTKEDGHWDTQFEYFGTVSNMFAFMTEEDDELYSIEGLLKGGK